MRGSERDSDLGGSSERQGSAPEQTHGGSASARAQVDQVAAQSHEPGFMDRVNRRLDLMEDGLDGATKRVQEYAHDRVQTFVTGVDLDKLDAHEAELLGLHRHLHMLLQLAHTENGERESLKPLTEDEQRAYVHMIRQMLHMSSDIYGTLKETLEENIADENRRAQYKRQSVKAQQRHSVKGLDPQAAARQAEQLAYAEQKLLELRFIFSQEAMQGQHLSLEEIMEMVLQLAFVNKHSGVEFTPKEAQYYYMLMACLPEALQRQAVSGQIDAELIYQSLFEVLKVIEGSENPPESLMTANRRYLDLLRAMQTNSRQWVAPVLGEPDGEEDAAGEEADALTISQVARRLPRAVLDDVINQNDQTWYTHLAQLEQKVLEQVQDTQAFLQGDKARAEAYQQAMRVVKISESGAHCRELFSRPPRATNMVSVTLERHDSEPQVIAKLQAVGLRGRPQLLLTLRAFKQKRALYPKRQQLVLEFIKPNATAPDIRIQATALDRTLLQALTDAGVRTEQPLAALMRLYQALDKLYRPDRRLRYQLNQHMPDVVGWLATELAKRTGLDTADVHPEYLRSQLREPHPLVEVLLNGCKATSEQAAIKGLSSAVEKYQAQFPEHLHPLSQIGIERATLSGSNIVRTKHWRQDSILTRSRTQAHYGRGWTLFESLSLCENTLGPYVYMLLEVMSHMKRGGELYEELATQLGRIIQTPGTLSAIELQSVFIFMTQHRASKLPDRNFIACAEHIAKHWQNLVGEADVPKIFQLPQQEAANPRAASHPWFEVLTLSASTAEIYADARFPKTHRAYLESARSQAPSPAKTPFEEVQRRLELALRHFWSSPNKVTARKGRSDKFEGAFFEDRQRRVARVQEAEHYLQVEHVLNARQFSQVKSVIPASVDRRREVKARAAMVRAQLYALEYAQQDSQLFTIQKRATNPHVADVRAAYLGMIGTLTELQRRFGVNDRLPGCKTKAFRLGTVIQLLWSERAILLDETQYLDANDAARALQNVRTLITRIYTELYSHFKQASIDDRSFRKAKRMLFKVLSYALKTRLKNFFLSSLLPDKPEESDASLAAFENSLQHYLANDDVAPVQKEAVLLMAAGAEVGELKYRAERDEQAVRVRTRMGSALRMFKGGVSKSTRVRQFKTRRTEYLRRVLNDPNAHITLDDFYRHLRIVKGGINNGVDAKGMFLMMRRMLLESLGVLSKTKRNEEVHKLTGRAEKAIDDVVFKENAERQTRRMNRFERSARASISLNESMFSSFISESDEYSEGDDGLDEEGGHTPRRASVSDPDISMRLSIHAMMRNSLYVRALSPGPLAHQAGGIHERTLNSSEEYTDDEEGCSSSASSDEADGPGEGTKRDSRRASGRSSSGKGEEDEQDGAEAGAGAGAEPDASPSRLRGFFGGMFGG